MAVAYPKEITQAKMDNVHASETRLTVAQFPWFALQVRTKHELNIAILLRGKGYSPFVPLYQCRRQWSDRIKTVEAPLFPGYLFCRLNLQDRLPVLETPGVTRIVGYGRVPAEVDDAEINGLQTMVASGLPSQPWPFLQVGDLVKIERGALRGLQGVLIEVRGAHRLVLSITLLRRSVAVEIDPAFVRSLSSANPPSELHTNSDTLPFPAKKNVGTLGKDFSSAGLPVTPNRS
jgi:transcription antitermination factor NusG